LLINNQQVFVNYTEAVLVKFSFSSFHQLCETLCLLRALCVKAVSQRTQSGAQSFTKEFIISALFKKSLFIVSSSVTNDVFIRHAIIINKKL
jgi:hypothetical protein